MTIRAAFGLLQRLLVWVVLLFSGAYLLVYLYRWEWNRAIVSGIFFVAAEVALATSLLARRLRALERGPAPSPQVLDRLRSADVERPDPFRWLRPEDTRLGVFVPVLLGAGVVLSALAYLVERVAEVTAVPVLDRGLARRLAGLSPPPGGLAGTEVGPAPPPPRRLSSVLAVVIAIGTLAVLGGFGVQALVEATQTRPETGPRPPSTTIHLELVERGTDRAPLAAAEALWVACRATVGRAGVIEGRIEPAGGDRVDIVVEPGLGHLAKRRITGCLSDLTLDLVQATILDVRP